MYYEDYIPKRLAQLRQLKKVSARDMSLSLGQSENYINMIENRKSLPSMSAFFLILDYLGATIQEFFDEENPNPEAMHELLNTLNKLDGEDLTLIQTLAHRMVK